MISEERVEALGVAGGRELGRRSSTVQVAQQLSCQSGEGKEGEEIGQAERTAGWPGEGGATGAPLGAGPRPHLTREARARGLGDS